MFILTTKITRVFILQGRGADKVSLHTTEPSSMPAVSSEPLCLDFVVAAEEGAEYVRQLGIPDRLVEVMRMDRSS